MNALLNDVRFALRSLMKSRLFTLVALVSLSLGIAANVTIFSMVSSLALRPLPYTDPDRLVDLHEWSATKLCGGCGVGTSYGTFLDWKATARSFTGMGAYIERPFSVSGSENADRVGGALVSAGLFDLLGIHAALGRAFVPDDDRVGATPAVLLGDGLWNRRYAADRDIVGRTIRINGVTHTVIGVMPPNFRFPEYADLWVPFVPNAVGTPRDQRQFGVVARLKPDVAISTADVEMATIAKGIEAQYPETQREWTAQARSLRSAFGAVPDGMLAALLGAVAFVLLIVCANIAGLLLARGAARQREIAIRLALGATRRQIVRHLLTESVILSIAAGALSLILSLWGIDFAVRAIGTQAPFYIEFGLDGLSFAYCLLVSVASGLIFGLLPALRTSATDVGTALKDSGANARRSHARGLLVVGELALAMVLLAGAGELMKSFVRISTPEDGYDERDLLTGNVEFLDAKYQDPAAVRLAIASIVEHIRAIPGVVSAASDRMEFLAGFGRADKIIQAEGIPRVPDGISPRFYHVVTPEYFETVRLPIMSGRGFDARDRAGALPVVIIGRHMAESLWPHESPLGRRIKLGTTDSLPWLTIVGVSGDVSNLGRMRNYAYIPAAQATTDHATILARGQNGPAALIPAVRSAVGAVDADLPILDLQSIAQQQHDNYWPYEMYTLAMTILAAFAILLAAIGLYGVIAYNTTQRTREIGVRMALGAEGRRVVVMIASQGGRLVVLGIAIGIGGSALLLRALRAALFGASPVDVPIFAAVSLVLATVALAAVWLPARRAAQVDPLEALRAE